MLDALEDAARVVHENYREGKVGSNFVVRSTDRADLDACMKDLCDGLTEAGFDFTHGGI